MRRILLTLILVFPVIALNAQNWVYANNIGAVSSDDAPTFTAKDASGNLYVASNYSGTRTFGSGTQTAAGFYDAYVAKYDAAGNFVWFKGFGAVSAFTQSGGLAVDASGNVYLAGTFTNQIIIGGSGVLSAGGKDIFLCRLDPTSGAETWGRSLGGTLNEEVYNISIGGSSMYLVGNYNVSFTDGSVTIPAPQGQEDILVGKYDISNGACQLMGTYGGTQTDMGYGIAASSNTIYVTGNFKGTATFDTFSLTSANTQGPNPSPTPDMYLMKLDQNLSVSWVKKAGAGSTDQGYSVAQDGAGNVFIAGSFLGQVNFGNGVILVEPNGYGDGFIVKYNDAGNCLWGHKVSSGINDAANCVSVDPLGSVYVSGSFGASATITGSNGSNTTISTVGVTDGFIAKWGNDGVLRWALGTGSTSSDRVQSIVWGPNGSCQFVVNFSAAITAGTLGTFNPPAGGSLGQLVSSYNGLTAGLNDVNNSISIELFPNPSVNDVVTVSVAKGSVIERLSIYSVEGRLVYESTDAVGNSIVFDPKDFAKGNYLVQVLTSEGAGTQKLMVY